MYNFYDVKETSSILGMPVENIVCMCSNNVFQGSLYFDGNWMIPQDVVDNFTNKKNDKGIKKLEIIDNFDYLATPFVKWVGGKKQLLYELDKRIESFMNKKITKYAEPMVGGGALFFYVIQKYKFEQAYICDVNDELMNAYKIVRDKVSDLINRLSVLDKEYKSLDKKEQQEYYYGVRDNFNNTVLKESTALNKAANLIFLNKTCFNGLYRVNGKGGFNVPMGSYTNPNICDEKNLLAVSNVLKNVEIYSGDYNNSFDFIDNTTLVYFDPPYRPITKTAAFTSYSKGNFNDEDQVRLAEYARKLDKKGASVILSNSDPKNSDPDDNFFDDLYKGFNIDRVYASRNINSKGDKRGKVSELIITNN